MKKLVLLAAILPQFALADTGYYLVSTYDVEGQTSIDYKYWNAHYAALTVAAPEIGVGYGVTSRWYTELYATAVKINGGGSKWHETAWQNDFMLTQGQYDFDLALHTKIERPRTSSEGYGVEFGPVLQTEIGRTQLNFNVFFQRDYRTDESNPLQLTYQWQVKHRWKSWFQPGLQGFGEVGKWDSPLPRDQQSHRIGPAFFGSRDVGAKQELKYEAAYLFGKNSDRPAKSFTMRVQYIF
ncbi:hypothetical protein [Rugamonas sp.]|uniref:hypothetical protein n=1 Tax=Rugamonas sp. TaxID=1926287 RepID=UPI0025FAC5D4|nr:hypothetical protein [Rugamonas sp.]